MYVMTYNSLLVDARRYIERGFTLESDSQVYEQLPRLVTFAQRRCARDMKVQGFLKAVETNLTIGTAAYPKPDRWRETVSMRLEGGAELYARSYEYCRKYWPVETELDTPQYYADYDYANWLIVPTPVVASRLEIIYYEQPEFIDDTVQTNWLTTYAPDVLLYATLLEAMPFLKNDARIATWQTMYQQAVSSLSAEDMKRIQDRTAVRNEP